MKKILLVMALLCGFSTQVSAGSWNPAFLVNTESFFTIDDESGDDLYLEFGDTVGQTLTYELVSNRFTFSSNLMVEGDIVGSGSLSINNDQSGDAALTFGSSIADQTISLLDGENVFRFSTGATIAGSLTASNATLTSVSGCDVLATDPTGKVYCAPGSNPAFISVTTNADSNASAAEYDVFESANYGAPDFVVNESQNILFSSTGGSFTVKEDGTYQILATLVTTVSNDNTIDYVVFQNGVPIYQHVRRTDNATDPHESTIQVLAEASVNDTFEITVDGQTASRTVTIENGTTMNIFKVDGGGGGGSGLAPYITSASQRFNPSSSGTIRVTGGNFDYDTQISIPGWEGSVDAVRYLSDSSLEIDVTAGATETTYDLVLSNGSKDSTGYSVNNGSGAIAVETSTWLDLRLGGDSFTDGNGGGNDIRYRAGMSLSRDANGMFFSGSSPWSSWVKFESLGWTRGTNQTVEWIFTNPGSAMMVGIGTTISNEASTSQWQEGEVMAYFSTSTNLVGLYGSNGAGTWGNQVNGSAISAASAFKIKIESDGDLGDQFTLYELPSASPGDWDDESTVVSTYAIGGTLNPNDVNIMPFIIPTNGGTQRFVAVRVQ